MTKTLRRELAERFDGLDEADLGFASARAEAVDTAVHAVEAWLRGVRDGYALPGRGSAQVVDRLIREAVK
jgi:hypothetical protein